MPEPAAEVHINEALVANLLGEQHPDLAGLPIHPVGSGWDNAIFRLGSELLVRLPSPNATNEPETVFRLSRALEKRFSGSGPSPWRLRAGMARQFGFMAICSGGLGGGRSRWAWHCWAAENDWT